MLLLQLKEFAFPKLGVSVFLVDHSFGLYHLGSLGKLQGCHRFLDCAEVRIKRANHDGLSVATERILE